MTPPMRPFLRLPSEKSIHMPLRETMALAHELRVEGRQFVRLRHMPIRGRAWWRRPDIVWMMRWTHRPWAHQFVRRVEGRRYS